MPEKNVSKPAVPKPVPRPISKPTNDHSLQPPGRVPTPPPPKK